MKIRAILETETMDPDFREPFLNGMPFDITESTFDRIVRYASGCTDVQQPDVIAMVNLYKLTNLLESGMTIFQLNQWKNEGIWYPITQYKKESNEIEVVTNVFTPLSEENPRFHIQLSANYDTEKAEWNQFLEDNQWKLYPLLRNILNVFLPPHEPGYRILYTLYPEGFLSVIAEPLKSEEA